MHFLWQSKYEKYAPCTRRRRKKTSKCCGTKIWVIVCITSQCSLREKEKKTLRQGEEKIKTDHQHERRRNAYFIIIKTKSSFLFLLLLLLLNVFIYVFIQAKPQTRQGISWEEEEEEEQQRDTTWPNDDERGFVYSSK